jgi:uncharacterized alpha-E superfamily protein
MLSRVADNLYWMSRYLERAEHISRLMAVKLESMLEQSQHDAELSWRRVVTALAGEGFVAAGPLEPFNVSHALAFNRLNPSSLVASLALARDNGRQVREQISTQMWSCLNRLYLKISPIDLAAAWNEQPAHVFRDIVDELYMLEGIAHSTMRHAEGWDFLQLGRYIERAQLVARLLDIHFGPASRTGSARNVLDWIVLLRFCTAFEAYCKVYTAAIRDDRIAEFLLFDQQLPHSVRFAVERVSESLARVGGGAPAGRRAACDRLAGKLKASLDFGQIDELMGGSIGGFLANIRSQCEQIHDAVYTAYIAYDVEPAV